MNNMGLKVMCFSAGVPAQDTQCAQSGYLRVEHYRHRSERNELTGAGALPFKCPGALDWRSDHRFKNAILSPYMRRSSTINGQDPAPWPSQRVFRGPLRGDEVHTGSRRGTSCP